jgi:hypothetical protein
MYGLDWELSGREIRAVTHGMEGIGLKELEGRRARYGVYGLESVWLGLEMQIWDMCEGNQGLEGRN